MVTYLTVCKLFFINILGSTVQRCNVAYGFSKEERKSILWKIRIDIHSGLLIAGESGNVFDIWGDAINIASRLEIHRESEKIHISEKTRDDLKGLGQLTSQGKISNKDKGGWSTFFLESFNSCIEPATITNPRIFPAPINKSMIPIIFNPTLELFF